MRTTSILLLAAVIHLNLWASDTLTTRITQATVFLNGAQVFCETGPITIKPGVNTLVIKNVSPDLNPNSIQASKEGNFLILDVQHTIKHFEPQKEKPNAVPLHIQKEINQLDDSLVMVNYDIEKMESKLKSLDNEKNMIVTNKLMTGGGRSDSLPVLIEAVKFYRSKLDEIDNLIYSDKLKLYRITIHRNEMQARSDELKQFNMLTGGSEEEVRDEHNIVITTYSEGETSGKITVNYLVGNAGWLPAYDLRANDINTPMTITYKAYVYQNSGEEWDNIRLVLSTYNQNCFIVKPSLGIWRLDYYMPGITLSNRRSENFQSKLEMQTPMDEIDVEKEMEQSEYSSSQQLSEINTSFSNVEFKVKLPYSVPSDGEQVLMVVNNFDVQADFHHYMVPRENNNAFIVASVENWEELNFLPGRANIYFRKTYVGQTEIDPAILKDTMDIALGTDQSVISTRKKLKDEERLTNLGLRKVRTLTFELLIRNNGSAGVDLDLEDQIPVSANEDIKVELIDSGGALLEELTGILIWKFKMEPGEIKKIKFSYSIESDRSKTIP